MKIPKELKVGAVVYTVKEVVNMPDCGRLNRTNDVINILKELSSGNKAITLLHEALHQINGGLSEDIVDGLAFGLHQLLEENELY